MRVASKAEERYVRELIAHDGLRSGGNPRPSSPAPVFAEDFSLLLGRAPKRLRIERGEIQVLS